MSGQLSWPKIEEFFSLLAHLWRDEGRTPLYFGVRPTAAADAACDEWARRFALNAYDDALPPEPIRPWMVARATMASTLAGDCERRGVEPPEKFDANTIAQFLVGEWHYKLRSLWPQISPPVD